MSAQTNLTQSYFAVSEGHQRIQTQRNEASDQHNGQRRNRTTTIAM